MERKTKNEFITIIKLKMAYLNNAIIWWHCVKKCGVLYWCFNSKVLSIYSQREICGGHESRLAAKLNKATSFLRYVYWY